MNTEQKPDFYGWKLVAILFCTYMIGLGLVYYGFPVLFPAMINDMGWGRGEASIAQTIMGLMAGLTTPLAAILINRFGSRKVIILGFVIMLMGLLLLSTCISKLWHWIVIWGFLMPFALAFGGLLPHQTTVSLWFNKKRATALGIIMTGAGIGGFLAQPYYAWLIGKGLSWKMGWFTASGFILCALILTIWIRSKPEDMGQYPDGISSYEVSETAPGKRNNVARTYRTIEHWTLLESIKTRTVWLGMIVRLAQVMSVWFIVSHGVLHLTDQGYSDIEAASVISAILLGSTVARFPMGFLADFIELRWLLTVVNVVMLMGYFAIWQAPTLTILTVAGFFFGLGYGTIIILIPVAICNYWGPQNLASITGFMSPFLLLFGAPVPVWAGYIADQYGSYDAAFLLICFLLAIGFLCAFFLKPPNKALGTGYLPFFRPNDRNAHTESSHTYP
ncbi:MAG: MFS transporter [Thermodesulfobacteriota bacterium]|nr:MFS transporter [Thermodesulfobacteriota bacterium]